MPAINDEPSLLCPACGFDLRAATTNRCSECGLEVDRAALTVSGIPWAHRRQMGRFQAYFKTLWQFSLDRKNLRYEASKPQDLVDARSFRRINACILAVALVIGFGTLALWQGGLVFLAVHSKNPYGMLTGSTNEAGLDPRLIDLAVPWSAGATLWPVIPFCLILMAFWLSGAQRFLFRLRGSATLRQRALCLSHFTTAPLVMLLPASLLDLLAVFLYRKWDEDDVNPIPGVISTLTIASEVLCAAAIFLTLLRIGQWLKRTRGEEGRMPPFAFLELFFLWALGAIVLLGLFPWTIGFCWIAIDSLR